MQTRAWFSYSGFSIVRIYQFSTKNGSWYNEHTLCSDTTQMTKDSDCVFQYNTDLMDPVAEVFRWIIFSLILLSLILCLITYKWRWIANAFLYLECVIRLCALPIPNSYNEKHSNIDITMLSIIIYLSFYCDKPGHLIFATLHLAIEIFLSVHVAYLEPLTPGYVIMNVGLVVAFFACTTFVGMIMVYVQ